MQEQAQTQTQAIDISPTSPLWGQLDTIMKDSMLAQNALGFERVIRTAYGISQLQQMLTPEVMSPLMYLQGKSMGFLTDKDKEGGYPMEVVRDVICEAAIYGLLPVGNQFNIIKGKCYISKNGAAQLLENLSVRFFDDGIIEKISISDSKKVTAHVVETIEWILNGEKHKDEVEFDIRVNDGMSAEGVLGKAQRKARMWLFNKITNLGLTDADAEDQVPLDVTEAQQSSLPKKRKSLTAGNVNQPDHISDIRKKIEEKGINITIADIEAWCNATNQPFVASAVNAQFENVSRAVENWKTNKE